MNPPRTPPKFISFEGIDGAGKTTLAGELSRLLSRAGIDHTVTCEPGGTGLGERLREILLGAGVLEIDPWAECLLYAAARAQHVREVIVPALEDGRWVVSDRFADATLAYQGYGRGLDVERLRSLHQWIARGIWPHCTVLLDCDVAVAYERRKTRGAHADRLERMDPAFHERVRRGYLALAEAEPHRYLTLDAAVSPERLREEFRRKLCLRRDLFPEGL